LEPARLAAPAPAPFEAVDFGFVVGANT
jgi:hypothetical protein